MIRRLPRRRRPALAAATASAQFEGEATFKIVSRREKGAPLDGTAHMFSSKTGFRMEWEMETGSAGKGAPAQVKMVMLAKLPNPEKVYMVNDANRTYSVWDTKKAREDRKTAPSETYKVEKLGTDRVAGYPCQNARVTSSKGSAFDVCVTREFGASGDWMAAMNRNDAETGSWLKALNDDGIEGSPVRWSVRRKGSAEPTMVMELVRADKKALPTALFEVPAGYKETDFAMGGLTPEQEKRSMSRCAQEHDARAAQAVRGEDEAPRADAGAVAARRLHQTTFRTSSARKRASLLTTAAPLLARGRHDDAVRRIARKVRREARTRRPRSPASAAAAPRAAGPAPAAPRRGRPGRARAASSRRASPAPRG